MIIQTSTPQQVMSLDNEKKKGIVLIWFYAVWCGHCKDMEEDWDKLSVNHPKELKLAKVESSYMDNYKKSPGEDELRGYPTLRLYNKGELIKEYDGERSYESIYKFVEEYLKEHNNVKKNNLLLIKAKRGNKINKRLIKQIINNKRGTNKSSKNNTAKKPKRKASSAKKRKKTQKGPKKKTKRKRIVGGHKIKVTI